MCQALGLIFGIDDGIAIGLQYPDGKAPDARKEMALVATRSLFRCTTRNATLGVTGAADRKSPVYNYVFDHVASFSQKLWGQNYSFCWDSVRLCCFFCLVCLFACFAGTTINSTRH